MTDETNNGLPFAPGEDRNGGAYRSARMEGRDGQIWRAYTVYRHTQSRIAADFGISSTRVSEIIQQVRATIPQHDLDEMRQMSIDLYADLTRRAMEIVDLVPAPVVVGKDGDILYEDGEIVRDYSGRLRAIETAAKMDGETRKLMGLDSATKSEVSGSITYEVVGIDENDLS